MWLITSLPLSQRYDDHGLLCVLCKRPYCRKVGFELVCSISPAYERRQFIARQLKRIRIYCLLQNAWQKMQSDCFSTSINHTSNVWITAVEIGSFHDAEKINNSVSINSKCCRRWFPNFSGRSKLTKLRKVTFLSLSALLSSHDNSWLTQLPMPQFPDSGDIECNSKRWVYTYITLFHCRNVTLNRRVAQGNK